ncbi:MAG: hypothetical protein GX053_04200 [Tissierella sp.]|nr:hypothetical protein [Tissierella sp.]
MRKVIVMEVKEKRSLDKILIIVLLTAILILVLGIGFLLISENDMPDFSAILKSNGEYTIPLDEFVVNLKSENNSKRYLKISVALMYTNEDYGDDINGNMSKIRDLVISNLRDKSADDFMDENMILNLKLDIMDDINESINIMAIQDVYITDIIVQ